MLNHTENLRVRCFFSANFYKFLYNGPLSIGAFEIRFSTFFKVILKQNS